MSVEFIAGKPGAGKGLFAMSLVERELRGGCRIVVTNLALRLGAFNEYLQKKYPDLNPELARRVRILSEDELGQFYLYRGVDYTLELEKDKNGKPFRPLTSGIRADDPGVLFILDEIHLKFNSRAWMDTGPAAIYYLSQHRKLGDDVMCITQSTANVDKQFRSMAQEFHQIRNLSKERWGWFRGPPKFKIYSYLQQPDSKLDKPEYIRTFSLDLGLAACYDTAAGVGIVGKTADKDVVRKGVSVRWLYGLAAVAILAVVLLPMFATRASSWAIEKMTGKPPAVASPAVSTPPSAPVRTPVPPASSSTPGLERFNPPKTSLPPVFVRAVLETGERFVVYLTDGRVFTEKDGMVWAIKPYYVELADGSRYPRMKNTPQ